MMSEQKTTEKKKRAPRRKGAGIPAEAGTTSRGAVAGVEVSHREVVVNTRAGLPEEHAEGSASVENQGVCLDERMRTVRPEAGVRATCPYCGGVARKFLGYVSPGVQAQQCGRCLRKYREVTAGRVKKK